MSLVFLGKLGNSLYLDNDFSKTDKIWLVGLFQRTILIFQVKFNLFLIWHPTRFKFHAQCLLVHCFKKTTTCLPIDLKARTLDGVDLFLVNQIHFRVFRVFRGLFEFIRVHSCPFVVLIYSCSFVGGFVIYEDCGGRGYSHRLSRQRRQCVFEEYQIVL